MRVIRTRQRLAVFLAMAAVAALVAVGAAYALTASSFKYSSPKTGYVRIHNLAFAPDGFGGTYFNESGQLTGTSCATAGVDVPVGSRVKSITFYFQSGASSDFDGSLWRKQLGLGGGGLRIAHATPSNDAGTLTSVTVNVASINQPATAGSAYGITVCPGSDGLLDGARIKYTYTSAGS